MLKHILAFLALILVSLAPVYADEGYIPYFPDFLEPDGIGFRGPASIIGGNCWADKAGPFYEDQRSGYELYLSSEDTDDYYFGTPR